MITIVTPAFNARNYIELQYERLRPILSESIKWLIIDDCSKDDTFESVNKFNSSFIRYHRLSKNSGPSAARHKGSVLAKTDYLFFLDADDVLFNSAFLEFYDFIMRNKNMDYFYAPGYMSKNVPKSESTDYKLISKCVYIKNPVDFIRYGMPNYSSLAVKKEFFQRYIKKNDLPWGEDIVSYLQMSKCGNGIKWIKPVSCYVIAGGGRGSSVSIVKRFKLFNNLITESFEPARVIGSLCFTFYLITRYSFSYLYKKLRG